MPIYFPRRRSVSRCSSISRRRRSRRSSAVPGSPVVLTFATAGAVAGFSHFCWLEDGSDCSVRRGAKYASELWALRDGTHGWGEAATKVLGQDPR